jgi:Leucine-rich repeat (LRR) protein
MTGTIPAALSSLTKLEWVDLGGNDFTGLLPDLAALSDLVLLDVRGSSRLSPAPIPSWVGNATLLRFL